MCLHTCESSCTVTSLPLPPVRPSKAKGLHQGMTALVEARLWDSMFSYRSRVAVVCVFWVVALSSLSQLWPGRGHLPPCAVSCPLTQTPSTSCPLPSQPHWQPGDPSHCLQIGFDLLGYFCPLQSSVTAPGSLLD